MSFRFFDNSERREGLKRVAESLDVAGEIYRESLAQAADSKDSGDEDVSGPSEDILPMPAPTEDYFVEETEWVDKPYLNIAKGE